MQRKYSLRKPADYQRVRSTGACQQHTLLAMYARRSDSGLHVGFAVGRRFGSAVRRNRVRRRMREAVRLFLPSLETGWDLLFVARSGLEQAAFNQLLDAVERCLSRSGVLIRKLSTRPMGPSLDPSAQSSESGSTC